MLAQVRVVIKNNFPEVFFDLERVLAAFAA